MMSIQYRAQGRSAKQLVESVESGIESEALRPGDLLPSVRLLATELGIAPGTVAAAFKLLRDRGLVQTSGRNGTRVSRHPPLAARSATNQPAADVTDLASGQPDPNLLPFLDCGAGRQGAEVAAAPEPFILPRLLDLARLRFTADAVPCEAMTVASGGLDAIHRVLSAQLRLGDPVAVEDPGWGNVLDLVAALGFRPVPMAMDADGVRPERLQDALRSGARAVIITNRAQNPTGVSLTLDRAAELRAVLAGSPRTLVIEDDHAAELAGDELASVAGVTESWAFVRSTSKPYGPDLRVAVLAGDPATISRVEIRMRISSGWVSTILQRSVIELWTSTEAAATVVAAGQAYDSRRGQLIAALAGHGIPSSGHAGLNVWIPVVDETTAVASLMQARWAVAPGSRFRQSSPPGIRVTVSGLDANTIPLLAGDIATAIAGYSAARYST